MWSTRPRMPEGGRSRLLVMRWRGLEPPRPKAATRPSTWRVYQFRHQRAGEFYRGASYWRTWKSATELSAKSVAMTTVSRVRLRSTMCVPPCDAA